MCEEKDNELKGVKSDCAGTLLTKEKSNLLKMQDLETKVVDLEFSNQKLIQKIHDLEQQHKEEIDEVRASHGDALKVKDRSLKEMRAQRDCLHQELQEMKGGMAHQRMRSPNPQGSIMSPPIKQDSILNQSINMSLN